jgi:hypothetical protein
VAWTKEHPAIDSHGRDVRGGKRQHRIVEADLRSSLYRALDEGCPRRMQEPRRVFELWREHACVMRKGGRGNEMSWADKVLQTFRLSTEPGTTGYQLAVGSWWDRRLTMCTLCVADVLYPTQYSARSDVSCRRKTGKPQEETCTCTSFGRLFRGRPSIPVLLGTMRVTKDVELHDIVLEAIPRISNAIMLDWGMTGTVSGWKMRPGSGSVDMLLSLATSSRYLSNTLNCLWNCLRQVTSWLRVSALLVVGP